MPEQIQIAGRGDYSGSVLVGRLTGSELTDATPGTTDKATVPINDVRNVQKLIIDVVSDKGGTLDITRYLDPDKSYEGEPATQGIVAPGGPSRSFVFDSLGCYAADIVFNKTEAGSTSGFAIFARGEAG